MSNSEANTQGTLGDPENTKMTAPVFRWLAMIDANDTHIEMLRTGQLKIGMKGADGSEIDIGEAEMKRLQEINKALEYLVSMRTGSDALDDL